MKNNYVKFFCTTIFLFSIHKAIPSYKSYGKENGHGKDVKSLKDIQEKIIVNRSHEKTFPDKKNFFAHVKRKNQNMLYWGEDIEAHWSRFFERNKNLNEEELIKHFDKEIANYKEKIDLELKKLKNIKRGFFIRLFDFFSKEESTIDENITNEIELLEKKLSNLVIFYLKEHNIQKTNNNDAYHDSYTRKELLGENYNINFLHKRNDLYYNKKKPFNNE